MERLSIRVTPKARKTTCEGVGEDGVWRIRLAAPPVDGKANTALLRWLAETLDLPRNALSLLSGERSRHKVVGVSGLPPETLALRLSPPHGIPPPHNGGARIPK